MFPSKSVILNYCACWAQIHKTALAQKVAESNTIYKVIIYTPGLREAIMVKCLYAGWKIPMAGQVWIKTSILETLPKEPGGLDLGSNIA